MNKNRFWELLAKIESGEATPEEQLELSQHLSQSPEDQEQAQWIDAVWNMPVPVQGMPEPEELNDTWNKFRQKISSTTLPVYEPGSRGKLIRIIKGISSVAAILLLAIGGWLLWNSWNASPPGHVNSVSTRNGSKSKIELPDGTQVWLNAGSNIKYNEEYGKENREITLTGEAYFDVVHNEKKPFIIHTPKMNVKVLGTIFNVKAYPNDEVTEAALIRGSIEVTFPDRPQERLILKPNDKITIVNGEVSGNNRLTDRRSDKEKPAIAVSKVSYQPADSAIIETSWVNNKLIFRSKTFEELSKDMERWFNVTVQVKDSAILQKKFTGTFSNESITDALYALSLSSPFEYTFNKASNTVLIYKK